MQRILPCILVLALAGGPLAAQAQKDSETLKAEIERLRAELRALREEVAALKAELKALRKDEDELPRPPLKEADPYRASPDGKSGVEGDFWYQYFPGPAGAKAPRPEKRGSATVRLFRIEPGKKRNTKPDTEGKFNGKYRLIVPPGEYQLEVLFDRRESYELTVTIKAGKMLKRDLWLVDSAP